MMVDSLFISPNNNNHNQNNDSTTNLGSSKSSLLTDYSKSKANIRESATKSSLLGNMEDDSSKLQQELEALPLADASDLSRNSSKQFPKNHNRRRATMEDSLLSLENAFDQNDDDDEDDVHGSYNNSSYNNASFNNSTSSMNSNSKASTSKRRIHRRRMKPKDHNNLNDSTNGNTKLPKNTPRRSVSAEPSNKLGDFLDASNKKNRYLVQLPGSTTEDLNREMMEAQRSIAGNSGSRRRPTNKSTPKRSLTDPNDVHSARSRRTTLTGMDVNLPPPTTLNRHGSGPLLLRDYSMPTSTSATSRQRSKSPSTRGSARRTPRRTKSQDGSKFPDNTTRRITSIGATAGPIAKMVDSQARLMDYSLPAHTANSSSRRRRTMSPMSSSSANVTSPTPTASTTSSRRAPRRTKSQDGSSLMPLRADRASAGGGGRRPIQRTKSADGSDFPLSTRRHRASTTTSVMDASHSSFVTGSRIRRIQPAQQAKQSV